jgi:hypothetical protein
MKTSAFMLAVLVGSIFPFACEPPKDETRHAEWRGGHGYSGSDPRARHAREFKEEYLQGRCGVERQARKQCRVQGEVSQW